MCQFEDWPIISKYPRDEATKDEMLNEVFYSEDKPVVSTIGINQDFKLDEILAIFYQFKDWKEKVEPGLPEEDKLFSTNTRNGKVWVIEDGEAYTVMYPHEY